MAPPVVRVPCSIWRPTGATEGMRAIPEEKWQRKGHEFVRLYVAIRSSGRTVAEVLHTAIFRPRKAG